MPTLQEEFWKRVYKTNNCWFWIGTISTRGYGQIIHRDKFILAHHLSWFIHRGEWPLINKKGKYLMHTCDTRQCVRIDHLVKGTPKENSQDAIKKGVTPQMHRTKCSKCGGPYTLQRYMRNGKEYFHNICRHCKSLRAKQLYVEIKFRNKELTRSEFDCSL